MRKSFFIILFAFIAAVASARPATNKPVVYTLPDGSTITVRLHGDERRHWITDLSGNPMKLGTDGYLHRVSLEEATKVDEQSIFRRKKASSSSQRVQKAPARFPVRNDNIGTKRGLAIMVEFSNRSFQYTAEDLSRMLNEEGYSVNGASGSVRDFYIENSHGLFTPEFDVYGPYPVDARYNSHGSDGTTNTEAEFFSACQKADADIDFSKYDSDGDGYVDLIAFYFAGYNQAEGGASGTIWPYQWSMQEAGEPYSNTKFDEVYLANYFCTSEFVGSRDEKLCSIGTTCHEFAHSLGLPDFYDSDYQKNGQSGGMNEFSVMDYGADLNEGRNPCHFTVLERIMLGWIKENDAIITLDTDGSYTLPPVYEDIAFRTNTSKEGEFFLYEYRDKTKCDRYLPEGMVVYHIDQSSTPVKILNEYGKTITQTAKQLWDNWEQYNSINENGSHPCGYVVAACDPDNLLYGYELYGGYYYYVEDVADLLFPGSKTVTEYSPKDWSGNNSVHLSEISCSSKTLSFNFSSDGSGSSEDPDPSSDPSQPEIGYNYIIPLEPTESGVVTLAVKTALGTKVTKTEWFIDDKKTSSTTITLNGTEQKITAKLTLSDGSTDVIELVLNPQ